MNTGIPNPEYEKATHKIWFPALQMSPEDPSSPLDPKNQVKVGPQPEPLPPNQSAARIKREGSFDKMPDGRMIYRP